LYVYKHEKKTQGDEGVWLVGFYVGNDFHRDDVWYTTRNEAAARVNYLNGGKGLEPASSGLKAIQEYQAVLRGQEEGHSIFATMEKERKELYAAIMQMLSAVSPIQGDHAIKELKRVTALVEETDGKNKGLPL